MPSTVGAPAVTATPGFAPAMVAASVCARAPSTS